MNRASLPLLTIAVIAASPWALQAEGQKLVKVAVEVRRVGTESREAIGGSGRVVITEKKGA